MTDWRNLPPIQPAPPPPAVVAAENEYRRWFGVDSTKAREAHRKWMKTKAESLLKDEVQ